MKKIITTILLLTIFGSVHAASGCPEDTLVGVHTAPGTAWNITITDGKQVRMTRIGDAGKANGIASMRCAGETIVAKFRQMSHGIKYDCIGELDGNRLRNNMTCINPDTGVLIGHIRGSDAEFQ
jgi:hypothetical protein